MYSSIGFGSEIGKTGFKNFTQTDALTNKMSLPDND